ncbi:hypothetical protein BDQ94DRAFT_152434, partial [Aspergillus welwitschiae]
MDHRKITAGHLTKYGVIPGILVIAWLAARDELTINGSLVEPANRIASNQKETVLI